MEPTLEPTMDGVRASEPKARATSEKREHRPTRRAQARALFHRAILDAAEAVFAEQGFHGARIHDIADRARMAVGTIYNHFGQKEDVLRELVVLRVQQLSDALAPKESDPVDYEARLTTRIGRVFVVTARHRGFFLLTNELGLTGGAGPTALATQIMGPKPLEIVERFRAELQNLVVEGIEAGALVDVDPSLLVELLGAMMRTIRQRSRSKTGESQEADAKQVVSFFMHGAARPTTPSDS